MRRTCKKCGIEKDIEEFTKASKCMFGRSHRCKECHAKATMMYRNKNKERISDHNRRHKNKNKEKILAINRNNIKNLSDLYIKSQMCQRSNLKASDITQEMIELKREILQYKRIEKELKNVINSG